MEGLGLAECGELRMIAMQPPDAASELDTDSCLDVRTSSMLRRLERIGTETLKAVGGERCKKCARACGGARNEFMHTATCGRTALEARTEPGTRLEK